MAYIVTFVAIVVVHIETPSQQVELGTHYVAQVGLKLVPLPH